jgi:acetylornithine/N-succinyldiaminopimelate aminotransferase
MDLFEKEKSYVASCYTRQPIALVKGRGAVVWDSEGREYIDCFSGLAVLNTGHCHPRVVEAIKNQASRIMHTSNIYYVAPQVELAERLYRVTGGYKSFFCNSGAEANEAAIKLARKYTGKKEIICAENSFHGRTLATLSATGQDKYKHGFGPLIPEFIHVKYGDAEEIEGSITDDTAAVLLEPIQGEGGVVVPPDDYLRRVREICDREGVLLILDEVQTGMGRTGELFAWQLYGARPDVFTLAKALGGGFPIGAMLARGEVMDAFKPGDHASTFGGNHLACAAAKASLETIIEEDLPRRAGELGAHALGRLQDLRESNTVIKEIRGKGLMIGIELEKECAGVVERARERGLLINCTADRVVRLLPPLVIQRKQLDRAIEILGEALVEDD